jgi:hypothetical protein
VIGHVVQSQATILAYIDVFVVLAAIAGLMVPLALSLRAVNPSSRAKLAHWHFWMSIPSRAAKIPRGRYPHDEAVQMRQPRSMLSLPVRRAAERPGSGYFSVSTTYRRITLVDLSR